MIPGIIAPTPNPLTIKGQFIGAVVNATTTAAISNWATWTQLWPSLVVITLVGANSVARTVNAVTITGTTGTLHLASASSTNPYAIASRVVSSGLQGIDVTYSSTAASHNASIGIWTFPVYSSTTPVGTNGQTLTASTILSTTFPVSSGALGFWGTRNATSSANAYSSAIIRSNTTSGVIRYTFGDRYFYAAASSFVESVSGTTSASRIMVGGAFR
jgi:hypothetical protein